MFRPWKGVLSVGLVLAALPVGPAMAQGDTTAPTISVVTPAEGDTFTQGQTVKASYTCADDSGTVQTCAGPVASGADISTATVGDFEFKVNATDAAGNAASVTRHYSVKPVESTPGGETPATLNLTLGAANPFSPFIPGLAKDYTTTVSATLTSTALDATLWVADPSPVATGRLMNGTFALESPLKVSASSPNGTSAPEAEVGGSAAPTKLLTYGGPLGAEAATLSFKQTIGGGEALRTGGYSKTLTFTLSTENP
jgi:hypothetical protein